MNQAKELFAIKQLEWASNSTETRFDSKCGHYTVIFHDSTGFLYLYHERGKDKQKECNSIEHGKQLAEAHHHEQILKHLTKVESGWLPIESAPTDGSVVMVFDKVLRAARWSKSSKHWFSLVGQQTDPTHWMPLPEPPKL